MTKKTAIALLPVFWPNLPPLSLASLKGFLIRHNVPVDVIDFNNYFFNKASPGLKNQWRKGCNTLRADFNYIIERLLHYDVIGFSCYKSNFPTTLEITNILKSVNPRLKIILGGPEITRQYFKSNCRLGNLADFLVVGEGELPLLNYLTTENLDTKVAEFWELQDLSGLPAPDYTDFDINNYPKKQSISIMYSRGCYKKCRFCSERLLYKKFRVCSADNIIAQIRGHRERGIEYFVFHDSLINGDLQALELLCDEIIKNFGSVKWEAQLAIRKDMPDRLFRKIKDSGCYHLFVGLESGCERTLINMNKGFTARDAIDFFRKLKSARLSFGVSIIVGYPTETHEDFTESLNFLIRHRDLIPKIEQVNPYVYYDGTDIPPESVEKACSFISRIKEEGFKHTRAFMLNLVEDQWKPERSKSPQS